MREWQAQLRMEKFKNLVFWLVGLLSVGGVGFLAFSYYQDQNAPRPQVVPARTLPDETGGAASVTGAPLLRLSDTAAHQMEDLLALRAQEPPEGGAAPLDATWVKQAGMQLVSAEKAISEGRLGMALNHYRRALEIYPELRDVQRYIGTILLEDKQFEAALEAFAKALAEPGVTREIRCGILNNMGGAHRKLGKPAEAEKFFREAIATDANYLNAHFNLAGLMHEQNRVEEATALYMSYLEKDPRNSKAAQHYASLLVKAGRWKEAAVELEKIVQIEPDIAPLHFYLAQALAQSAQADRAVEALQRAVKLVDSSKALAWINQPEFDPIRASEPFQNIVADLSRKASRVP
jgi:Tfp pilus assembly protein PilF